MLEDLALSLSAWFGLRQDKCHQHNQREPKHLLYTLHS